MGIGSARTGSFLPPFSRSSSSTHGLRRPFSQWSTRQDRRRSSQGSYRQGQPLWSLRFVELSRFFPFPFLTRLSSQASTTTATNANALVPTPATTTRTSSFEATTRRRPSRRNRRNRSRFSPLRTRRSAKPATMDVRLPLPRPCLRRRRLMRTTTRISRPVHHRKTVAASFTVRPTRRSSTSTRTTLATNCLSQEVAHRRRQLFVGVREPLQRFRRLSIPRLTLRLLQHRLHR